MRNLYSQGLGSRPMISRVLDLAACWKCPRPATVYMWGQPWCATCFKALEVRKEAKT